MAKVVIDTDVWTTQAKLAKKLKVKRQAVNNWITREQIKIKHIPELDLTLVDKNATKMRK